MGAQYSLGWCYKENGDYDLARTWLRRAADAGHVEARGSLQRLERKLRAGTVLTPPTPKSEGPTMVDLSQRMTTRDSVSAERVPPAAMVSNSSMGYNADKTTFVWNTPITSANGVRLARQLRQVHYRVCSFFHSLTPSLVLVFSPNIQYSATISTVLLNRCNLNDACLQQLLLPLTNLPSLTSLDLSDNELTALGVQYLVDALLQPGSRLCSLNLSNNWLSPAGAQALTAPLAANVGLQRLTVANSGARPAGISRLDTDQHALMALAIALQVCSCLEP